MKDIKLTIQEEIERLEEMLEIYIKENRAYEIRLIHEHGLDVLYKIRELLE